MTFGERIAARREQMGWSQRQLGKVAEVPHTVISELERGVRDSAGTDVAKKLAFAVSEANAEDLVQRLSDHPTDEWSHLIPDWLQVPCLFTSVRQHDDMVVLAGADHRGWPVCLPLDNARWDDFERRHPDHSMPFWACWNLASDALELCGNVQYVPVTAK